MTEKFTLDKEKINRIVIEYSNDNIKGTNNLLVELGGMEAVEKGLNTNFISGIPGSILDL
jgi:hypothetical protein